MMVTLACDTGYLVKGNAEADENTVKISVSGNSKYAEQLSADVKQKADDTLKALDINGKVEKVEALQIEALRQMALSTSLYTEEEINAMDEKQLYRVISLARVETASLLTTEMREAYHSAKEYQFSFAKKEQTAKVIEAMGGIHAVAHAAYKTALDTYGALVTELDELRYDTLVSPESEYQKTLAQLRDSKAELLKQKNYVASLEVNGEEYAAATVTLQMSEENYNKLLAAYEKLGKDLNASFEFLIAKLREAEAALVQLENTLFDANIEAKLQEKAEEIEANLNATKAAFFADFESAHVADIQSIEQSLMAKKQQLRSEIAVGS
jgi:hypothetical protein